MGATSWRAAKGCRPQQGQNDDERGDQADERVAHGILSRRIRRVAARDRLAVRLAADVPSRRPDDRCVRAGLGRVCAGAVPGPGRGPQRDGAGAVPRRRCRDLPARLHRGAPVRRGLAHGLPARRAQPEHPVVGAHPHAGQPRRRRNAQPLPGPPDRRPAVLVPLPHGGRHRLRRLQPDRRRAAARVPAEGRVPLDRRPLGNRGVGGLDAASSRRCSLPTSTRSRK